jgi:hypothetical protein
MGRADAAFVPPITFGLPFPCAPTREARLSPLFETKTYTHCRNDRTKLNPLTESRQHAFCCRGCYVTWYRKHCLVCDRATAPRSPDDPCPTRNLCSRDCRNAFQRKPGIFEAFGVPTGRKAAAAQRQAVHSRVSGKQRGLDHPGRDQPAWDGGRRQQPSLMEWT